MAPKRGGTVQGARSIAAEGVVNGVHLVGDGSTISFIMHQDKSPLLANVLYYAEQLASEVSQVARRIGG